MKCFQRNGGNNNNNNSLLSERKWKDNDTQNIKDHSSDSPSIFQKPKLHNLSSSPRRNKADTNNVSGQSKVTSQSSMYDLNGTSGTLKNITLERGSSASSTSTLISTDQILHRELLDNGREICASDSLASTVLSMAFTGK
jgi:hypothetical protein